MVTYGGMSKKPITVSTTSFIFKVRPGHNIRNPKSEPNPNQKTRSVSGLKCKKYPNGFCKAVRNISEPEVLLTEHSG